MRVLLDERVDSLGLADAVDNLNLGARSIILVLATRVNSLGARSSGPRPDPVNSENVTGLLGGGNVKVGLTPLLNRRSRLVGNTVREALLALGRDGTRVDLVAASVVVALGGKESATLVTTVALGIPLENVGNLLSVGRLSSAVDKDRATRLGLARLVLRKSNVAVFKVLHGNIRAR